MSKAWEFATFVILWAGLRVMAGFGVLLVASFATALASKGSTLVAIGIPPFVCLVLGMFSIGCAFFYMFIGEKP